MTAVRAALPLALSLIVLAPAGVGAQPPADLEFLGVATVPSEPFEGTELGGLSALAYDADLDQYYALSDDPSLKSPARFYTLEIDLLGGRLEHDGARVVGVTTLTDQRGRAFPQRVIDGEGLALTPERTLILSAEGNVRRGIPPSIREVDLDGRQLREFSLPEHFLPGERRGARHNNAFECLTLVPGSDEMVAAVENALLQDGPESDVDQGSRVRISRFDRRSGKLLAEYAYTVDPVVDAPATPDLFGTNGLVDLLALDRDTFLALERSFTVGAGNAVRLYLVSTEGAQDVKEIASLEGRDDIVEASKSLLIDLTDVGIYLDNLEGSIFGPNLPDGRRSLVLISDNNFNPMQVNQVLAFAAGSSDTSIPSIQGAAHRSPLEGRWILESQGIVSATDLEGRRRGFWMESETADDSPTTSEGLFVRLGEEEAMVRVGDLVAVGGRVAEVGRDGELPVTRIEAHRVDVLDSDLPLPKPVSLASIPPTIDDDGLEDFEPETDAIDLYESLEGMRVSVDTPKVVGPTTRYGTLVVAIGDAGVRTAAGGLLLTEGNLNSNRLVVDSSLVGRLPAAEVGRRLATLSGPLDYAFGHFRLVSTTPIELGEPGEWVVDHVSVVALDRLSVASFNVENLDAGDAEEKYRRVAAVIAFRRPDIVALQEIQDDSGSEDNGTVSAKGTLGRLLTSIETLEGPSYDYAQIDPVDNADGGAPGGNIRVAFLYNPERVRLLRHERLFENEPAFRETPEKGYEATRKPLLAEFEFGGEKIVAINVHLKSKRGDDRTFGPTQPPLRHTEVQRNEQTRLVGEHVAKLLEEDPKRRVLALGDFNEHEFRPPMRRLEALPLTNLIERLPKEERYTYNFEGNSQSLDHILVSAELAACDPFVHIVRVNADLPHDQRASDHDMVFASFDLSPSVN